jgi:hypothetical protein
VELVLRSTSSYLSEPAAVNDPLIYVKNLRNYIEPVTFKTTTVKDSSAGNNDRTILRFSELKRLLATNVPPIPFPQPFVTKANPSSRALRLELPEWRRLL